MKIFELKKRLGDFKLNIPYMELDEGQIHAFMGGNGSGKTTLAKLIAGLLEADSGRIDYGSLTPRDCTMTTQRPYLLHSSVYENLLYPLKIRGRKADDRQIDSWLEKFSMQDKKMQYARALSSGERQKLAFMRALIFEPRLVILDETSSNLDMDSLEVIENWIIQAQSERPITWILISHRLNHLYKMCERYHFLDEGTLLASGTRRAIFNEHSEPKLRRFISKASFKIDPEDL